MARLPNVKSISREQFRDPPSWIELLLSPINQFFELVYNALNRDISFTENIRCQIKTIQFSTPSTYDGNYSPDKFIPITFPRTLNTTAIGLWPINFYEVSTNFVYLQQAPMINWFDNNGIITINFIGSLKASKKYSVTFVVI
jgi:hypothetical protein